jgi:hypothetical protein
MADTQVAIVGFWSDVLESADGCRRCAWMWSRGLTTRTRGGCAKRWSERRVLMRVNILAGPRSMIGAAWTALA